MDWIEHESLWVELFHANVVLLRNCVGNSNHERNAKRALNRLIRAWTDYPATYVSLRCLNELTKNGVDVKQIDRRHTLILGRTKGTIKKSVLVFEHVIPVNQFIQELIELETRQEINKALRDYPGVCWITRQEDDQLNKNGYKNKRNRGWFECYVECGINPVLISTL